VDTWFCFTFIFRTVRVRIVPNNAVVVIRTALERTDSVRRGYARPCFGLALACDEGRSGSTGRIVAQLGLRAQATLPVSFVFVLTLQ